MFQKKKVRKRYDQRKKKNVKREDKCQNFTGKTVFFLNLKKKVVCN